MLPGTDRTRYREVLASLVQQTQARHPALNGRLTNATKLALLGDVDLHDDGTATVHSASDPTRHYRIDAGTCTCRDYEQAPEHLCQHRLAAGLVRKARARMADTAGDISISDVTPAPAPPPVEPEPAVGPLPEAPVSITLRATLHGHEVLVTLRGHDFASVQAQVEQASAWLKSQAPAGPPEGPHAQDWCAIHHIQMRLNRGKDGKPDWFSHKTPEGTWCKGQRRRS